jgi:hypothetical protein
MNVWQLPKSAQIGGRKYEINADFRDVLEILTYLNDTEKPEYLRWQVALGLFFEGEIPRDNQAEAMEYLSNFISYGNREEKQGPKLIDWDQDAQMIISDVNKVAGTDVRSASFLHWWTFLSYFFGIGEGQLSTVVSIRAKKQKGKKLEKHEEEYYRENKERIDFKKKYTAEEKAALDRFTNWLQGGDT